MSNLNKYQEVFNSQSINAKIELFENDLHIYTNRCRGKSYSILIHIIQSGLIENNVAVEIDNKDRITFKKEICLSSNQFELVQSLIQLRKRINSPYGTTPEIMEFISNLNDDDRHLAGDFNEIFVKVKSLKGIMEFSKDKILVEYQLKEKITLPNNG